MNGCQTLVGEVHRRVLVEYVRAIMRGRVICTSSKMRKRMAFRLQDEAKQLKGLFKDLVSLVITQNVRFIETGNVIKKNTFRLTMDSLPHNLGPNCTELAYCIFSCMTKDLKHYNVQIIQTEQIITFQGIQNAYCSKHQSWQWERRGW